MGVLFLRNLDPVLLAQLHDDVQKIHAVELDLFTKGNVVLQSRQVFIRDDSAEDFEQDLPDFFRIHSTYSNCPVNQLTVNQKNRHSMNRLTIRTELIPSMPNELFKMYV